MERAVEEHGAPNRFTPAELWSTFGARMEPRHIAREAPWICAHLRERGWCVTYTDRAFVVDGVPGEPHERSA
ncbi:MAG TPA: hypothetical protein VFS05_14790 [Gemmatimonadaceae bacterium]|nr:hypothetical protein [Gemmatimonadaceae bacterium]